MSRRPNILLIMSDQHNPHIMGYAGNQWVDTPTFDQLAQSGKAFTSAYCNSPLCVPSRMSFLTGRYPHHCSAWDNQSMIDPSYPTIPSWLGEHGYTTASVGKMHFRGKDQHHGFQARPYGDLVDTPILIHQPDPPDTADGRAQSHAVGRFPFAGVSQIPESMQQDRVVTQESLAWLLDYASQNNDQPWFFTASYYRPHFPLTAPRRYIQKYQSRDIAYPPLPDNYPDQLHPHDKFIVDDFNLTQFGTVQLQQALNAYYACVDYVDDLIGELLSKLKSAGCLDNTYVIYTSDHGDMAGEHGLWWKRTYYDASASVPLIVTGPDITDHSADNTPVELVDLFPTICDWAGIEHPQGLDGESLVPLLNGKPENRQKKQVLVELLGGARQSQFRMIRENKWKYVTFPDATARLFDLETDPEETHDHIATVSVESIVTAMNADLQQFGSWEQLAQQQASDKSRWGKFELIGKSAAQYHLADGRIIDGDDHLYDGSSLEHTK